MFSFHETQFPTRISYGSKGGPGYSTNILRSEGGQEVRILRMSQALRPFDIKYGIKSHADLREVMAFYLCRYGCGYGFRFKDWMDFSTNADHESAPSFTDVSLGTGNGVTTQFQLRKVYSSGSYSVVRNIVKPVNGTVRVSVNSSELLTGFSVDTTTGKVTIATPPTSGQVVRAGCYFDTPVRFGEEVDKGLLMSMDDFDQGNIGSIPLYEILDTDPVPTTSALPGGSVEICASAPFSLNLSARMWVVNTELSGTCYLPPTSSVPTGGPIFVIVNDGPSDLVIKWSDTTTTLLTIVYGQTAVICLSVDGSSVKTWYAV